MMASRECSRCSALTETNGAFCPNCGAPYGPTDPGVQAGPSGQTNGMAIASLVLAISCCSPLGVVFGHIAKKQIRERGDDGGGLATAGLVLGYLGLAVLAVYLLLIVGLVLFADG